MTDSLNSINVLDHGLVELLDIMGDDNTPAESARVSYASNKKVEESVRDNESLTRYLLRHKHTSPFEMIEIKWRLKMPIFVARQHNRHRTANINEVSYRYSQVTNDFYIPDHLRKQSKTNHQGSSFNEEYSAVENILIDNIKEHYVNNYALYESMISVDISRELARTVLPVSTYTEMIWKIDLRNLFNYLVLRMNSHAQKEIKVYAKAMFDILEQYLPMCMRAFTDYMLNAQTFSSNEMSILILLLFQNKDVPLASLDETVLCKRYNLSSREYHEFLDKLGLTN